MKKATSRVNGFSSQTESLDKTTAKTTEVGRGAENAMSPIEAKVTALRSILGSLETQINETRSKVEAVSLKPGYEDEDEDEDLDDEDDESPIELELELDKLCDHANTLVFALGRINSNLRTV